MLCKNCKSELPSNSSSCPRCGVALNSEECIGNEKAANGKRRTAVIIAIAVAFLAVICIAAAVLLIFRSPAADSPVDSYSESPSSPEPSNDSPEAAAEAYVRAIAVERSTDAFLNCVHEDIIDAYVDAAYSGDRDEFLSTLVGSFALLDGVDVSYQTTAVRELTDTEREYVEAYYDESTEAVAVSMSLTFCGTMDGEAIDESSVSTYITVQLDGKWYVDPRLVL